jgi:hypothetical protein
MRTTNGNGDGPLRSYRNNDHYHYHYHSQQHHYYWRLFAAIIIVIISLQSIITLSHVEGARDVEVQYNKFSSEARAAREKANQKKKVFRAGTALS